MLLAASLLAGLFAVTRMDIKAEERAVPPAT
jgi:hypothetical protein